MVTIEKNEKALFASWSSETSYYSNQWESSNPAYGQCYVTALIIQDYLGGEIIKTHLTHSNHYWNRIDGIEYDLTRSQFINTEIPQGWVHNKARDEGDRYHLLKVKVAHQLKKQ